VDPNAVLALYGLPPEQFTAARNQLAKTLRDTGDESGSTVVKALRKPTIAAWLANRLVRIAPDQVAELTEFGDELRQAHVSADRARLKQLTPRRHAMVQRIVDLAKSNATGAGRAVTTTTGEYLKVDKTGRAHACQESWRTQRRGRRRALVATGNAFYQNDLLVVLLDSPSPNYFPYYALAISAK
jgi:hypothetical protein